MKKILLTAVLLFISTQLLAQGPPAPPPAPSTPIPWGNPAIYMIALFGYQAFKSYRAKKRT